MPANIVKTNAIFEADIDGHMFKVTGSLWSGMVRVVVDDTEYVQSRSLSLHRTHIVELGAVSYRIDFQLRRFWANVIAVMIFRENELIFEEEIRPWQTKGWLWSLASIAMIGFLIGYIIGWLI